ncbi:hypothetical protein FKZ61_014910 [Litorilinea aerophila]|uniref:Uncharacterized protein n=1 Tax=Litorilinea aerophila TaxID=1204385 RepID=A0A540VFI9_9CHLR|nr:hypothetical protein [Litorilinea aerophila]MCC9077394.1 hypothetical protein [Litorilinea aerophila]
MDGLTLAGLVRAHLALATLVQEHGRIIAVCHGFAYPEALEAAVMQYVAHKLTALDIPLDDGL